MPAMGKMVRAFVGIVMVAAVGGCGSNSGDGGKPSGDDTGDCVAMKPAALKTIGNGLKDPKVKIAASLYASDAAATARGCL